MDRSLSRDRIVAGVFALVVQLALGWLLLSGLIVRMVSDPPPALAVFDTAPRPVDPPLPPPEATVPSPEREGEAAPPNLRADATPVVAPPTPLPVPSPVIAAPIPFAGFEADQGAAEVPGPGTGRGGEGDGTGSGRSGDGGGAGGAETPPVWRSGRIRDSDYPADAGLAGASGRVEVRYLVTARGRVGWCDIERSSGSAVLDDATCRLIRQRFRFRPSRDARGQPVDAVIVEAHEWIVEDLPPEEPR